MSQPNLEHVDYLPLKWKKEKLDKPIFNITYQKFNAIWHRLNLVAGLREDPRIYSLRVGAAGRLDGKICTSQIPFLYFFIFITNHSKGIQTRVGKSDPT